MQITKRPKGQICYPNACPVCGKSTAFYRLSDFIVISDGDQTIAVCSKKCARAKIKECEENAK